MFCLRETTDVLVLAESPFEGQINLPGFVEAKTPVKPIRKTGCRLEIYHRNTVAVTDTEVKGRAILQTLRTTATQKKFLMVSTHLHSPLGFLSADTRQEEVRTLATDIRNKETELQATKTLLLGDLNYDPYHTALIDAYYLNAVPTKSVARRGKRVLLHESVPYFYNPMWAHLSDRTSGPPGTYYRKTNNVDCRFWYLFDQVLLRPDLLDFWDDESLHILSHIGKISLLHKKGAGKDTPNRNRFSDHLPITFGLSL